MMIGVKNPAERQFIKKTGVSDILVLVYFFHC